MQKVLVLAVKGGTGKSTTTAGLAKALRERSFRVGLMDLDMSGANLPSALGMPEPFPYPEVDVARGKMFPIKYDGFQVFSLAFRYGKSAVLSEGEEKMVSAFGRVFPLRGTSRKEQVKQMLFNVEFGDLDYLLFDLPPSTGDEALTLFQYLQDIYACILVSQPTNLSAEDMDRALDMIREKHLPLLGMVGNMTETVCPKCGAQFSPFVDAGVDLEKFCKYRGIPYLVSIPLTCDRAILDKYFSTLAERVIGSEPVRIWEKSFRAKLESAIVEGIVKGVVKVIAKGEKW